MLTAVKLHLQYTDMLFLHLHRFYPGRRVSYAAFLNCKYCVLWFGAEV